MQAVAAARGAEHDVVVYCAGFKGLVGVERGAEWISKLPGIVAEASCILYEALLEPDE